MAKAAGQHSKQIDILLARSHARDRDTTSVIERRCGFFPHASQCQEEITIFHMISATFPYPKQRQAVMGVEMAYAEVGTGDPIVFLHGNPTYSYVWRNIIPAVAGLGRVIAPDL